MSISASASPPALAPCRQVEDPVITARALTKVYGRGAGAVTALDAVDVDIARGRFTAVMGPSGSGKSTLMHCLAGLDSVTSGTIVLDGDEVSSMSQRRLTRLRRERIGFIFQAFNLVPTLTAAENITLPLDIARVKVDRERFDQVVQAVGIADRLTHRPAELSGGQVQRVACARALVGRPAVVFADEPTGNLDSRSTVQVLEILRRSVDDLGQSVVMVTHEPEAAAWADTVLFLRDGHVVAELGEPDRDSVLDALRVLGEGAGPLVAQEAASVPQGRDGADAGQGEGRGSYQRPGA
ncbi:ABC transporter ATP-binding protein [uncultured Actinomyces sp.]|uniref:ABC transporter ATP-binding protein n=1 Tax=uncultured Actinomyces sp. TaxID=249061 RepID=UPI002630ACE4|nr:ABC transporter ATP-binding protein [uncultured Actinomyces sp.]